MSKYTGYDSDEKISEFQQTMNYTHALLDVIQTIDLDMYTKFFLQKQLIYNIGCSYHGVEGRDRRAHRLYDKVLKAVKSLGLEILSDSDDE